MERYLQSLQEASAVFSSLADLEPALRTAAGWCLESLRSGGKILSCGNGGSAAEADHLCVELMGRYKRSRPGLAAVALNADSALLTCVGNDYSFEDVFARLARALGRPGDILVAFTTSGNSPNVLAALEAARDMGLRSVAFLGSDGGKARDLAACPVVVAHPDSARVQEAHQFLMHCLMDQIEAGLPPDFGGNPLPSGV
jgi:D-sedoheptulose 7-phosphate isomerase